MSARQRATRRMHQRNALAALLARHAPRGAVRVAEALAAVALNRARRAERIWNGAFAGARPALEAALAELPDQGIGTRADAAWAAVCRRIAARALAGATADPTTGAHCALPWDAAAPAHAPILAARIGPYAFYRAESG